jgi:molybdate transport system ATP-binding protein
MTLEFSARLRSRGFDVDLEVAAGETLAILGPNGSGKSTLLESIVGLVEPDAGLARLDGNVLFDLSPGSPAIFVPPHKRGVSLLAQNALLFPRMTVRDNVAFGPQSTGAGRRAARERAAHWLEAVEATEFAGRKPRQLSGGQAQRIAIARALASEPRLLLLDEPMAALDITVTPALRRLLRRVLAEQTTILVTHDVLDAFTLADRVAVMNAGRIVELGETREVFERPRSPFTAALVGLNLLVGVRTLGGLRTADGVELMATGTGIPHGAAAGATVPPRAIRLSTRRPSATGANAIEGHVADIEPRGEVVRVSTEQLFADVGPAVVAELDLVPGTRIWCSFESEALSIYAL